MSKVPRRWVWVVALCGGVLLGGVVPARGQSAAPAPAPQAAGDTVERTSWRGEVPAAKRLEVFNPFGDLRLRYGGAGRTVEVAAALQQLDPAGSRLALVVEEKGNPATIRIVRTAPAGPPPSGPRVDRSRADIVVLVPGGLAVVARSDRGLVESQGVESDVDLETATGPIRVRSTVGRVTARSDGGEISAVLKAGVTAAPQELSTVTGSIEVWAPDAADLDVALATSGRLVTDFSLKVEHRDHEEPDKVATATVGRGGHPLDLKSLRGDLSLRRLLTVEDLAPSSPTGGTKP